MSCISLNMSGFVDSETIVQFGTHNFQVKFIKNLEIIIK